MGKKNKESIETDIFVKERVRVMEPKHYSVIMLNDDFTPMDFVVEVLKLVFHKSENEANQLMMAIHKTGQAVVGTYTYDIAVSKRTKAVTMARAGGYPLRVEVKEA